jgi:NTE family protein
MTRALVLGGGGPVGVAWQSGLAVGLAQAGVDVGEADLIVGTSAGSIVGSRLALRMDLAELALAVGRPVPVEPGATGDPAALMTTWADAYGRGLSPQEVMAALGELSVSARTLDEESFLAAEVFAQLDGHDWPASFRCTAVDTATGTLHVWDQAAGVPLTAGVASSCSVPGVFPPVSINGSRFMDGGMRTPLNADIAAGHSAVIAVSCLPLALPEGFSDPMFDAILGQTHAELSAVRDAGGKLEVIVPGAEFLEVSGWGANLMDPSRSAPAYQAGLRQAGAEADRMREVWTG